MVLIRTPVNQTIIVKPHVQALANALGEEFGLDSFGTYLGHSPPEGPTQAFDIFTPDNAQGYALQDRICAWLMANQKRFGIRYCIRRHQIWNIERATEGWREQGVTGNRTADHMDHVHDTDYATAPGPFGVVVDAPQKPTTALGEDMLIVNVKDLGIFLLRGDNVEHLQHPDHVMEFVRAGVPYQDKNVMSSAVFTAYTGWTTTGLTSLVAENTRKARRALGMDSGDVTELTADEMIAQTQAAMDQMKEEYYAMMRA